MNISAWCIRNPIPAIMLFVMLTFAGIMSYRSMKVQNFPDLDLPTVLINASLPGASPNQLETDVARKLENSLASLQGLKHINTTVQDGMVSITVEFLLEKPVQEAVDDVRSAVSQVRSDLPSDLRDPEVSKLNISGTPILSYTISATSMDDEALSWFVDNELTKKLLLVKGLGKVTRVGGVNRQITVSLDPAKIQALNTTVTDISHQLKLGQMESSGGRTKLGGSEQPMRTIATVDSAEAIGNIALSLSDGRKITLNQVASVTDSFAEPRSAALLDGKPVVGFEISRSKGASEIEVGDGVQQALAELKLKHPDIVLTEAYNFVQPVKDEYKASLLMLIEGAILAVLVVLLFLRNARATFICAVALPLSVIPAFTGMAFLGFSINIVTLLALSLVIGILVDDAIVEVENIVRHLRMGKSPYQAAMEAADEIGLAVVATTFTLIAVFLPTAFMSGIPGKFFKQFGWTAAFAIFASLVVARVLTPMMSAYLLKPTHTQAKDGVVMQWYLRATQWCLRYRWLTVIAAVLFLFGSIKLIPLLPTGFVPADDSSITQVYIELAPGATLEQTKQSAEEARQLLLKIAHIKTIYTAIGGGSAGADAFRGADAAETRLATLTIMLDDRSKRPLKQVIEEDIRAALVNLSGVRSRVGLGGQGEKYILMLSGDDTAALKQASNAITQEMRSIPGIGNIASTASLIRPEMIVRPDFNKAADLGVTSNAISETLRIATNGDYDFALAKLNLSQRQVPVVVQLSEAARQSQSVLEHLAVPGAKGSVMLGQVASFNMEGGPSVIDRYDRSRNVQINVELAKLTLGEVTEAINNLPSLQQLPAGIKQLEVGDAEMMGELFGSFALAMLTGVLCIYIVLVILFKDFLQPVTILVALPLSLGGAFVALLVAHKSFSMPSLIGLVMLMGIATKNSILLVEYAIVAQRDHGLSRFDALVDACHKRARPIVMTTIAMGAGMLPIAAGWSSGDTSFRSPMAVAVIGGLITSTFLSLLVIPAVFSYVDDIKIFFKRVFAGAK
ncbi:MAG: efflux RND transporter permease subunit [Methylophilaceae bacterium]